MSVNETTNSSKMEQQKSTFVDCVETPQINVARKAATGIKRSFILYRILKENSPFINYDVNL